MSAIVKEGQNWVLAFLNRAFGGRETTSVEMNGDTGAVTFSKAVTFSVVPSTPITDTNSNLTATDVDGAIDEIAKYIPISLADPGTAVAIPVTRSASISIVTAAAETNTLAIPSFKGQKLVLTMDTRAVGDRVITSAQRINQTGNTIMTFGAAGDSIVLEAVTIGGALRWQVTGNDGVALS